MPEFQQVLTMFNNPIFGVFIGAVVTAIIQSSAASIGILQALSMVGGMTYGMAIPIVMGQNIGTCISAVLSCSILSKMSFRGGGNKSFGGGNKLTQTLPKTSREHLDWIEIFYLYNVLFYLVLSIIF